MLQILGLTQKSFSDSSQSALLQTITAIRSSLHLETILTTTTAEVRQLLEVERVCIFRFEPDSNCQQGDCVAESAHSDLDSILHIKVQDFGIHWHQSTPETGAYIQIQVDEDIQNYGSQERFALAEFQVRANLVAPLIVNQQVWGLLCLHQCSGPRHWHPSEISTVELIAQHVGVAIQQAECLAMSQQDSASCAHTLTHMQNVQTQAIQNEKMSSLGELVAGMAHEVNNPINFIYGNLIYASQYIEDLLGLIALYEHHYSASHPDIQNYIQRIELDYLIQDLPKMLASMQVGADRIRQLVVALRNFSRIDEAAMKPVDIHEGIDSALLILQYRLKAKAGNSGIHVMKDYGELPLVECFPGQLNQVFMNLLSNAIDALDERNSSLVDPFMDPMRGHHAATPAVAQTSSAPSARTNQTLPFKIQCVQQITIRTFLSQENLDQIPRAVICITDNGPGIPDDIKARIFDAFFTTKPSTRGTGLGLSISHQIITVRHNGTLSCTSEVGEGTEFRIEIPIQQTSCPLVLVNDTWR